MKHTPGPWIPAAVGCYWNAGDYHISTVQGGGESYYRVALKFDEIGRAQTLEEAQAIAERDCAVRQSAPELLEALRRCIECLNGPVSDLMTGDALAAAGVYGALIQAGAAIAKAGGRE